MKKKAIIFMLLSLATIPLLESCEKKNDVRPAPHKCQKDSSQTINTNIIQN
jgi:hypothetical protein